ncbi:unnamed protein product, partial [Laminaria digitata]
LILTWYTYQYSIIPLLFFVSQQVVGIKSRDNPDWWMASLDNGAEGWVPANYLEMF